MEDGSHPTAAGSYLAACVFFATLFDQRPVGTAVSDRLGVVRK
jgi:nitrate/nitrite transporter NarK